MKINLTNNSILSTHFLNYQEKLKTNNKLISTNLNELEIKNLYNKKYHLTEFDIYKYITAYDLIIDSLGCEKYSLTEGITANKNKYNNILIDLFYKNISPQIIRQYSLSIVFGIKQVKYGEIQDLTPLDIKKYKLESPFNLISDFDEGTHFDIEYWDDDDTYSQWFQEYKEYKSQFGNYAGNSYTYYIFKLLLKLYLTEVYLFNYNGNIVTYKELGNLYNNYIFNRPDPQSIKPITKWVIDQGIFRVKYSCIKVVDPSDIKFLTLSDLKLYLIDTSKISNCINTYDTLVEKTLDSFWDYDQALQNRIFIQENKN